MALPQTKAQYDMLQRSIAEWLAKTPVERDAIVKAQMAVEAKFRDAIGFPWHKASPHDT